MPRHDPSDFTIPESFWNRRETREALELRDAGALFQLVRQHTGASQTGLTMRTGIAKSEISAIMSGQRRVTTLERFESIADGLGMPDDARQTLGIAAGASPAGTSMPPSSSDRAGELSRRDEATRIWNISPPVRGFRGRGQEMLGITACMQQAVEQRGPDVPVVTLHGIPGIGKSQLARAFADSHKRDYRLGWWVTAETRLEISTGLGQLAVRLGASEAWSPSELLNYLFDDLAERDDWLIVLDNATAPADVEEFLPPTGGERAHLLVTSRNPTWRKIAGTVAVDVLPFGAAVALLREWSHDTDGTNAPALVRELGQLPLAIEQAAAYTAETALSLADYLTLFRAERARLLAHPSALAYPGTVAATVTLALDKLQETSPPALRLLEMCSLCSPVALPIRHFLAALHHLEEPQLRSLDAVERFAILSSLRQSGLVTADADNTVRLHRVTRVIIEDRIADYRQQVMNTISLLGVLFPERPSEPNSWPACAGLAPHASSLFVHARREDIVSPTLASLLTRVGRYLLCSGLSFTDARDLHEEALRMRERLHPGDHPEVARGLVHLAVDLNELGDPTRARELHVEALAMRQRLYGCDHPDLAHSFDNLGNVLHILGEYEAAREHHEASLAMRRRLHPGDHPNVGYSLSNLAADLHQMGRVDAARTLNEEALAMRRRLERGDHPDVAHSLHHLAADLFGLGRFDQAERLNDEALTMRLRLYPRDHPTTVQSLQALAANREAQGSAAVAARLRGEASAMRGRLDRPTPKAGIPPEDLKAGAPT